jgi:cytochrome c556
MNQRITRVATTALTVLGLAACGQSPDGGAAAPQAAGNVDMESPEFLATEYRQGLMEVIAFKAGQVRGMANGDIPVDEAVFLKAANDLAAAAGMLDEAFPAGTDSESLAGISNALPAIWSDANDFNERRVALQTAARTVAAQAQAGGFTAAQAAAAEQIGPACGGCHRNYRQRTD